MWSLLIPICLAFFYLLWSVSALDTCDDAHARCSSIPALWPFLLLYALFIAFDDAPEHGGRSSPWVRSMRIWQYFTEYYPATCVPFSCRTSASLM